MKEKEYIAYKGPSFTVEWYFDNRGNSQALDYYKRLSKNDRIAVLRLFKRMGDAGLKMIRQNLIMKVIKYMLLNHNLTGF